MTDEMDRKDSEGNTRYAAPAKEQTSRVRFCLADIKPPYLSLKERNKEVLAFLKRVDVSMQHLPEIIEFVNETFVAKIEGLEKSFGKHFQAKSSYRRSVCR